ncbi:hypothetical protein Pcinc_043981, partial [Petrolisthes cinctipes]
MEGKWCGRGTKENVRRQKKQIGGEGGGLMRRIVGVGAGSRKEEGSRNM